MIESLLLEAVPGSAALVDGEGVLERVNRQWAQAGPDHPFLAGMVPGSNYLEHCRQLTKSADGHVSLVAIGIVSALEGKLKQLKLEYPLPLAGETRWFGMVSTPVDPGVVIAHQDITERMKMERRLRRNEQLFKATTEHALDLLAILTAEGNVLYASPSYEKILGYRPGTPVAWKPIETLFEDDMPEYQRNCQAAFNMGISPMFEYRVRHPDGTLHYLEARAVAVESQSGDRESILLTSRDISARKQAEAQQARMEIELRHSQKMEAIGQLAAGIAHEINTPCQYLSDNMGFLGDAFGSFQTVLDALRSLLDHTPPGSDLAGLGSKLEEQDIPYLMEEVPRAIRQSRDGLARISTIVKAMKVFAHPGVEGMAAVNLQECLENTLVVAQSEWKYVAEVETQYAPDLPSVVCAPGELNQVFLNLIVNAAHAIGEKGGTEKGRITVTTRALDTGAEIQIRDTGAGIPEAIRDRIFLPFFTTKEVGKGTGQGLAIAHSVVAKHGGSIDFKSEVGQGSCFTIRLPWTPGPITASGS